MQSSVLDLVEITGYLQCMESVSCFRKPRKYIKTVLAFSSRNFTTQLVFFVCYYWVFK